MLHQYPIQCFLHPSLTCRFCLTLSPPKTQVVWLRKWLHRYCVSNGRYWASIRVICVMLNEHSFASRVNIKSKLTWHSLGNRLSRLGASVGSFLTLPPTAFLEHLVYTNHKLFTFLQVISGCHRVCCAVPSV